MDKRQKPKYTYRTIKNMRMLKRVKAMTDETNNKETLLCTKTGADVWKLKTLE